MIPGGINLTGIGIILCATLLMVLSIVGSVFK